MGRECGYQRPSDGAPCVMGAMHLTKHYFAEEPATPVPGGASGEAPPDGSTERANDADLLPSSPDLSPHR